MKKSLLLIFICISAFALLSDFCHSKTKGFQIGKMASLEKEEQLETFTYLPHEIEEIKQALSNPFRYLKKGKYCFVFTSEDQKYVLKFFRKEQIEPSFLASLKWPFSNKEASFKKTKQKALNYASYGLSLTHFKEKTGTLCLQRYPSSYQYPWVTLYDNIGIKHVINLNSYAFILQKKVKPFSFCFDEDRENLLRQFALLLKEHFEKGVFDGDLSPRYNLGVLEGKLVAFDLDGLRSVEKGTFTLEESMKKEAKKMLLWLQSTHPELGLFLEKEMEKIYLADGPIR